MDTITKANELNYFFWSMICGVAMTIGLGALIYKLLLGDKLMNVFRKCYSYFVRAFCFLIKIIMWPVRFIAALIKRPIGVVVWHSRTGSRQLSDMMKVSKQRLRNRMRYKARKTNSSEEDE